MYVCMSAYMCIYIYETFSQPYKLPMPEPLLQASGQPSWVSIRGVCRGGAVDFFVLRTSDFGLGKV